MERTADQMLSLVKEIFNFNITRRLFFLVGVALSVVIGISVFQWIQEPIYRPLDYQITQDNFSTIIDTLQKANIKYKINEATGMISVPAAEINQANVRLSSAGVSKDDAFNFSFLNDKNKLGTSQFLENARFSRALEGDLAKTIRSIQGISGAKVMIAKPPNDVFADEHSVTTASIVVNIAPGYERDAEKVRAIIQLVAASVPGLDPSNIAITDQYGHYLSAISAQNYAINQEHLNYQKSLETSYRQRIQTLISPVLGFNKANIDVNVEVDFTQEESAKENYAPGSSAVRSEQSVSDKNSASPGAGVPGSLSNQPSSSGGDAGAGSTTHSEQTKNYELNKTLRYIKTDSPKITRISVAILLDDDMKLNPATKKMQKQPLSKSTLDKITKLVKASIGFNAKRGDIVTVVNTGFVSNELAEDKHGLMMYEEPWFWDLVKKIGGIGFGFIFLIILYRKLSPELTAKKTDLTKTASNAAPAPDLVSPEMIKLKNEQIEFLKELVNKDPNKVTGIIKKWVSK